MEKERISVEEAKRLYGITPSHIGIRHRGWWIVEEIESEEEAAGAHIGDLCVKSRDGGSNPPDCSVGGALNYMGTIEDFFDCTYRYYYFRPIEKE